MNNNKVLTIVKEPDNTTGYVPIEDIRITPSLTVGGLVENFYDVVNKVTVLSNELTTYKSNVKEAIALLQSKFDELSNAIEANKVSVTAELNNIKESIKLLGGVL